MNTLKFIGCLVAAAIVYFVVGLIVWNIVCTWIDLPSCTLTELSNYKVYTYSGVAALFSFLCASNSEEKTGTILTVLAITGFIAYLANHWESIWDSVALIISILYNLVNIFIMGACLFLLFDDDN